MNDFIVLWAVWVCVVWACVVLRPKPEGPQHRRYWK